MSNTKHGVRPNTRLTPSPAVQEPAKNDALVSGEPVQGDIVDWRWPATDIFADDPQTLTTCSELGSERIRLLKIRPGHPGSTIECFTKVSPLNKAGDYNALSYTWGCPIERHPMIIDQQPRFVTMNLWRFLQQARQLPKKFSGWLWIDALSIDQADPWEKLEQVKIISKVFRSAKLAVIWLGPAYGNSDKAMKALVSPLQTTPYFRRPRALFAPPIGSALLDICERPYWRRLWVFQELKAATETEMMCGSRCATLTSLERFILEDNMDERIEHKIENSRQSPAGKMVELTRAALDASLRAVLIVTKHLYCADPRDRVYAILAVAVSGHENIEADYTLSLRALLKEVLVNMEEFHRRENFVDVDKQCRVLEQIFGSRHESLYWTGQLQLR